MSKTVCLLCIWGKALCGLQSPDQKICLNMVVKNESDLIEKCLNSVKGLIDYWVISDSGSTDDTQELVCQCLQGIPGELHENLDPNQALALAKNKGDYTLLIEPYEVLEFSNDFVWPEMDKDGYLMKVRLWGEDLAASERIALIDNRLDWKWQGPMLSSSQAHDFELLKGATNFCNADVALRFDTLTALEKAVKENPSDDQCLFHLAKEYLTLQQFQSARECFEKRIAMKSQNEEETFLALCSLGVALENLGEPKLALRSYFQAYAHRPTCVEPLFNIAILYRKEGKYLLGYLLTKYALLYSEVNDYQLLIEFANNCLLLGKFGEGLQACSQLLANPHLPEQYKNAILSNSELARSKIEN